MYVFYSTSFTTHDAFLFAASIYVIVLNEDVHYKFLNMLFDKINEAKDLEIKWYNTLLNMPNGVTLY